MNDILSNITENAGKVAGGIVNVVIVKPTAFFLSSAWSLGQAVGKEMTDMLYGPREAEEGDADV